MKLAFSNIAWEPGCDEAVARTLIRHGINAIDVAHAKYFPDASAATAADTGPIRAWWAGHGISITGMQSLLYGTTGFNMFGERRIRRLMLDHLARVCAIGRELGATRLTFGSPKNRDRSGLSDAEAMALAITFFRELGDIASSAGVCVCLEANPRAYGCNFMTSTAEALEVVRNVGHPAIRLQLDLGAAHTNGENVAEVLESAWREVGHVHLSAPGLKPIQSFEANHKLVANALRAYLPDHVVAIEMLVPPTVPTVACIEEAAALARTHYG